MSTTYSNSRSGKYRVIAKGKSTFYPQVKKCFFYWGAVEYWGQAETPCYYDTMGKALETIDEHKRHIEIERIKRTIFPY